jgi:hypothetical protein
MATKLEKSIHREMIANGILAGRDVGRIIVSLEAGDLITFRQKGKRTRYTVPLQAVMNLALMNHLVGRYQAEIDNYNSGRRKKRPRKPTISIFNPMLLKALKTA